MAVPVLLAPVPHLQFFDANGDPLAGGKLFTYDAGTTNLRNTYVDSTGTTQNTNPIILDATGSPSNGSVETGIWLANQAYKFVAQNSLGVEQWSADNITGYFGLLNTVNIWSQPQTFTQPITITPVDNQIVFGVAGNQTTADFPPPIGNVTLHFPITTDTIIGRNTTDTLTNKSVFPANGDNSAQPASTAWVDLQVFFKSAVVVTHPAGATTEDTIWTVSLPALKANSQLRIYISFLTTAINTGVEVKVRLNGVQLQISQTDNTVGLTNADVVFNMGNRGATNSQFSTMVINDPPTINVISSGNATAVDTSVPQTLTITARNRNAADSQNFNIVRVELIP